jgi:ATP-binding cassette, subfamily B, multidrug efflux pump
MFGGGPQNILMQETSKPKRISETLARFGRYFKPYWYVLVLVVILVVASTWTQVTSPELVGQLVDCYLAPASSTGLAGSPFPGASQELVSI